MLKFHNYDIVFQEVPGEVALAITISNCPNRCKGCHSPHLMEDTGKTLCENVLADLLEKYGNAVTCVCFMGGDSHPHEVERLSAFLREKTNNRIKTAWYSGKQHLPEPCSLQHFDYIKLGSYIEHLGGLNRKTTNQRFYRIENAAMVDMTEKFYIKHSEVEL
jgi:anaerobic ribonucleoside-triphosphate reductase activating protein